MSKSDLEGKVETLGQTPPPDGMLEAPDGSVFLTDIEGGAIVRWNAATSKIEPAFADKRLFVARHDELGTRRRTLRFVVADPEHGAL